MKFGSHSKGPNHILQKAQEADLEPVYNMYPELRPDSDGEAEVEDGWIIIERDDQNESLKDVAKLTDVPLEEIQAALKYKGQKY